MPKFQQVFNKPVLKSSKFLWFTYLFLPVAFVLVLRNGINFWGYDRYALEWVKVWPKPVHVFSVENPGNLFLAKILEIDTRFSWMALHIFLTLIFYIILFLLVSLEQVPNNKKRDIYFLVLVSPITMLLMQEIGNYDVITMIGSLIFALRDNLKFRLLGTLILCAGNTPQALVITLIFGLFLNLVNSSSKSLNFRYFLPFLLSSLIWVLERFWLSGIGRVAEYNMGQWTYSFKGFLIASPLFLYALLGPIWLISFNAVECLQKHKSIERIKIFFVLLGIPGLFGIFTGDSTRVALCIMAPMLLWFIRYMIIERDLVVGYKIKIMMCFAPCYLVWREGQITQPWGELTKLFFP
jgi:hypothetical protein